MKSEDVALSFNVENFVLEPALVRSGSDRSGEARQAIIKLHKKNNFSSNPT